MGFQCSARGVPAAVYRQHIPKATHRPHDACLGDRNEISKRKLLLSGPAHRSQLQLPTHQLKNSSRIHTKFRQMPASSHVKMASTPTWLHSQVTRTSWLTAARVQAQHLIGPLHV